MESVFGHGDQEAVANMSTHPSEKEGGATEQK